MNNNENKLDLSKNDDTKPSDSSISCKKCNTENLITSKFCSSCGNSLEKTSEKPKKGPTSNKATSGSAFSSRNKWTIDPSFENKDLMNFIQVKTDYYIPRFKDIQTSGKSINWNWSAFFLGFTWFLYRKMYAYGFALLFLSFTILFIPVLGTFAYMVLSTSLGALGNTIYMQHVQRKLSQVERLDFDSRKRILLRKGGTNLILPLLISVFSLITAMIVKFTITLVIQILSFIFNF